MIFTELKKDLRVVRSKGDYVVGRVGKVVAIDEVKKRAQVDWDESSKTWVAVEAIEPEAKPYKIHTYYEDKYRNPKTGRCPYPKYEPL